MVGYGMAIVLCEPSMVYIVYLMFGFQPLCQHRRALKDYILGVLFGWKRKVTK
jgi:hypothetical protein